MPRSISARLRERELHGETGGGARTPEYRIWRQMLGRCTQPRHRRFADYGGRGISVCPRWLASLTAFIEDMGRRPSADHQLERRNNDGPYCKENCVWATRKEQGRNKRNNLILALDGREQPMSAWAEELGMPYTTLRRRKAVLGWSDRETLLTPVGGSTSERRSAAKRVLSAAQRSALLLLTERSARATELRALGCDPKKMVRRGLIAKSGAQKNDPYTIAPLGMQELADSRIEIGGAS